MRPDRSFGLLRLLPALGLALVVQAADPPAIQIDGTFGDWNGLSPVAEDPTGDAGTGNIDFGRLWVTGDRDAVFLRIETGKEVIWQQPPHLEGGHNVQLYIDADANPTTGRRVEGLGAELEIHFGPRAATASLGGSPLGLTLNDLGACSAPTHSGDAFEIRLARTARSGMVDLVGLLGGPRLHLVWRDGTKGDRLPDEGVVAVSPSTLPAEPVVPIPLEREHSGDLRILSHNVWHTNFRKNPGPFRRYLAALCPDVLCFQEVWAWTAEETRAFVASVLDPSPGEAWHASQHEDCVTVSRWPIADGAVLDGNLVSLIELPPSYGHALVVFNAHTPCCDRNRERDVEHDRIAATWRDLLEGTGPFVAPVTAAVVMAGDFNMVGFVRQLRALRDGDIIDNAQFGPDFAPARAAGPLANAPLRHTHTRATYTWRQDDASFAPGKLDYILYSGDVATLARNFALYTPDMPPEDLARYGLEASDSQQASDHLVLVADLRLVAPAGPR